jgi:TRIAD3 protein (E3 ubiquitin-protein ligase RNF216)
MEVIDIPSSPELLPTVSRITHNQSQQPGSHKRRLPLPPASNRLPEEIIEITDSDSEPEHSLVSPEKKRPVEVDAAVPGPSNLPIIGAPHDDSLAGAALPAAGSSQKHLRKPSTPLFYPDDEDSELQHMPMLKQQLDIPPAPVLPLVPLPQPPEPPVETEAPTDACVPRVLEIVPDVEPAHVLGLVEHFIHNPVNAGQNVLELVLHSLLENPNYPKVDRKGKRKRTEDDEEGAARGQPAPKIDYGTTDREYKGGIHYFELALEQLMVDFPYAPKPYLRTQLLKRRFYAPIHLFLAEKRDPPPYVPKSIPSRLSGKGREKHDPEFEAERQWLLQRQGASVSADVQPLPDRTNDDDACEECEDGIECGCCFSLYPFDKMVQCPETHLFCKSCMSSYASNLLGEHNPNIVCMDQSGCKLLFPQSELERFLTPKLLELYHRVRQRKDIEAAGLENLEECPFCDYKCVIENEMEKLFRCENVDCGAVSCRECKKPDHLPKSCKEVESDKQLDVQHIVEEAMTRALMRNCPKCQKAFIKEHGCNKMTCPNCRTVSCYICRKIINGYEHFGDSPNGRVGKNKCSLWDPVEQRHRTEVQEAAKKAIEEVKRDHPDIDESNIKIDLPIAGPAQPVPKIHPPMPMNVAWGLPALPNAHGLAPNAYGLVPNAYGVPAYGLPHAGYAGNMNMLNVHAQHAQQRILEAHQRIALAQRAQAQAQLHERMVQAQLAQVELRRQAELREAERVQARRHAALREQIRLITEAERHVMHMPPQLPPAPQPVAAPRRSQRR